MQKSIALHLGAGFFIAALISTMVIGWFTVRLYHQVVEATISEYGETVAHQLAQASVDAVVRGDLVSLHAQLEKLVSTNTIIDAAVYDMENRVLAQAGVTPNARHNIPDSALRNFPATISFQDSIAGQVIVSLDTSALMKKQFWLYLYLTFGIALTAMTMAALSWFLAHRVVMRYQQLVRHINLALAASPMLTPFDETVPTPQQLDSALKQIGEHIQQLEQRQLTPRFVQNGKHAYRPTEGSYAELMVACTNLEALQQQLHHRELHKHLEHFQKQLTKASKLYHAIAAPSTGSHVLLRFPVNDVDDAALQAICCAAVLLGLLNQNSATDTLNIALEFRFAIHWHEHDTRPLPDILHNQHNQAELNELLDLCRRSRNNDIIVTKAIKQSPQVTEHIKLELISGDSDVDYYRVQRISDNYKKLLEQQIQQLTAS